MDTLIYCFEAYDILESNPSRMLAEELSRELDSDTETEILKPCYSSARPLEDVSSDPKLVIGIGADPKCGNIQVEKIALNKMHSEKGDECGKVRKDEKIVTEGETAIETEFPARKMAENLSKRSLPAKISFHADTYVCNAAYYRTLRQTKGKKAQSIFIHVPLRPKQEAKIEEDFPVLDQEGLAEEIAEFIEGEFDY